MPPKVWNDINLPGFSRSQEEETDHDRITGVEDTTPDEEPDDEVRIVSAEWVPGAKGFQYNEQCFVDVTAEYLVETNRAQIKGNLFGIYDGVEVDMGLNVSGYIDDSTMIARISIPKLYFINNDHYAAWQADNSVSCQYVLKGINHTLGANTIDSPVLDMPNGETAERKTFTIRLRLDPNNPAYQNLKFTLYSTDDERSYEQVKTIRDDALQNNDTTELLFTDLDENLTYTFEYDAGNGKPPQIIFSNRAYAKWAGAADGLEEDSKASRGKKGVFFKKPSEHKVSPSKTSSTAKSTNNNQIARAKDLKSRADQTVNSVKTQVNDTKQTAAQTVNDVKSQVNDAKQSATQTVNDAKSQVDDIKQSATQTVNDAKSQVDDIKQSATQTVNDTRSQVDTIKQNASQTVANAKSQTNDLKKQAESTVSLKDKLAAINASREKTQKVAAAKETVTNAGDSLKSVPKFTILIEKIKQ
jgi:hypothetical protein